MINKKLEIREDDPHFAGHFPGFPILPGVAQIDLVIGLLREHEGLPYRTLAVNRAKFRAPIKPNTQVEVQVLRREGGQARWTIISDIGVHSTGDLSYGL